MKICFISEGSYPYIAGGVSSWINNFIKWFGNYEFKLINIGPSEEKKGKYVYDLPHNVTEICEIFLDSPLKDKHYNIKRNYLKNDKEKEVIYKHFSCEYSDWTSIFQIARRLGKENMLGFFSSREYLQIVKKIYDKKYQNVPFVEFIWLIRSMYIYQFWVLNVEVPEADVYHSVSAGYGGLVGAMASFLTGKPFVMTEHGIYTREREEEIVKSDLIKDYSRELWVKYFYNMSLCAYKVAKTVVSLFEKNKHFQIDLGCPESKILIIPNAIDIKTFRGLEIIKNRPKSENIIIGAVVRVVPIKDIITMLNGFALASKINSKIKLLIMGPCDEDEEYFDYCVEYVKKNDLKNVQFTGLIDVKKYLPKVDMLILSSISEAQPLSLLEAMACKVPCISTDVGNCSTFW